MNIWGSCSSTSSSSPPMLPSCSLKFMQAAYKPHQCTNASHLPRQRSSPTCCSHCSLQRRASFHTPTDSIYAIYAGQATRSSQLNPSHTQGTSSPKEEAIHKLRFVGFLGSCDCGFTKGQCSLTHALYLPAGYSRWQKPDDWISYRLQIPTSPATVILTCNC